MKLVVKEKQNVTVHPIFENERYTMEFFQWAAKHGRCTAKAGEILPSWGDESVILLGLGEREKLTDRRLIEQFYKLGQFLEKSKIEGVNILGLDGPQQLKAYEGLLHAQYTFERYKEKKGEAIRLKRVFFDGDEDVDFEEVEVLMESVFLSRDLVNTAAIDLYPETLAEEAVKALSPLDVKVTVYDKAQIEELGLKAFLSVSLGSSREPRLIVMEYNGDPESDKKGMLIGKGLTYDSGGYSIKTQAGMLTMQSDMAGSAAVIGAMKAIATRKLKKNVVAIVAATENLINGDAYKTGDIIGSLSGKSIEVISTDAEGRLTLADAITYGERNFSPAYIVDVATLTGAVIIALGDVCAGAITNDQDLLDKVKKASAQSQERIWELPNFDDYKEQNKSTFADIKNTGGRAAGTVTAGLFLGAFVEKTPWVHLDIAGVAFAESAPKSYYPKGASGFGVKLLYELVKQD